MVNDQSSPDQQRPLYTTVGSRVGSKGQSTTPIQPPSRRGRGQIRNGVTPQRHMDSARLLASGSPYGLNLTITPHNNVLSATHSSSQTSALPPTYAPIQQNEERAVSPDPDDRERAHDPFSIPSPPRPTKLGKTATKLDQTNTTDSNTTTNLNHPTKYTVGIDFRTAPPTSTAFHPDQQSTSSHYQSTSSDTSSGHILSGQSTSTSIFQPHPTHTTNEGSRINTTAANGSTAFNPNTEAKVNANGSVPPHPTDLEYPSIGALDTFSSRRNLPTSPLSRLTLQDIQKMGSIDRDARTGGLANAPINGRSATPMSSDTRKWAGANGNINNNNATTGSSVSRPRPLPANLADPRLAATLPQASSARRAAAASTAQTQSSGHTSSEADGLGDTRPGYDNAKNTGNTSNYGGLTYCNPGPAVYGGLATYGGTPNYSNNSNTSNSILARGPGAPQPLTAGPPGLRRFESSGLQEAATRPPRGSNVHYKSDAHETLLLRMAQQQQQQQQQKQKQQQQCLTNRTAMQSTATPCSIPLSRTQTPSMGRSHTSSMTPTQASSMGPTAPTTQQQQQTQHAAAAQSQAPVSQLRVFKSGSVCKITDTLTKNEAAKYYPNGVFPPNFNKDEDVQRLPENWIEYYPRPHRSGANIRMEALQGGWNPGGPIREEPAFPKNTKTSVGEELFGRRPHQSTNVAPGPPSSFTVSPDWAINTSPTAGSKQPAPPANWAPSWSVAKYPQGKYWEPAGSSNVVGSSASRLDKSDEDSKKNQL